MAKRMFTLRVDVENGGGRLKPTTAFMELDAITRADILSDIIACAVIAYNHALEEFVESVDWSVELEKETCQ